VPTNESHGKAGQATFLKVSPILFRHQSSHSYYGLIKRGGKQFCSALAAKSGAPAKDRVFADHTTEISARKSHRPTRLLQFVFAAR